MATILALVAVFKYCVVFVLPTFTTFNLLSLVLNNHENVKDSAMDKLFTQYTNLHFCVCASFVAILSYMAFKTVDYCIPQAHEEVNCYKIGSSSKYQTTFNLLLHIELFYFGISFGFLFLFVTFGQNVYGNTPHYLLFFALFTVVNLLLIILLYELEITKSYNFIIYLDFLLIFNNFLSNSGFRGITASLNDCQAISSPLHNFPTPTPPEIDRATCLKSCFINNFLSPLECLTDDGWAAVLHLPAST
ncbi:unnamed protein product [Bursaphelenchus okinawaensis]|uniref:Uncharacterized protein n=1 Tax=Bursaphelenchus okinawaensis TaxID=465554 RepID=A0A811L8E8_9BILA|nr:unnamed protein product [Bursaphelenchus okinawaensis]CAG9118224.1 unnamed protein product [Bursaphelenchus okinawaensis]